LLEAEGVAILQLYDERLATWAVDELREFSTNESVPFGMFVGFRRPHNNWRVPETLMQLYQDPPISSNQQYPQNAPPIGFFGGGFDFNNGTASNSFTTPVPEWGQRLARQGYWASVTQTDREVGRVLDALDDYGLANETAVFLFADHGWSLGEANQWHKHSNRVFPARVPLIVRAPWIPTTTQGILVNSTAVELIDLLPTIADVALGSPPPSNQYDGMSMRGVLENPANATGLGRSAAFWQYARCPGNLEKQWQGNGCTPHGRNGIVAMGYTVMTDDWRYTIWLKWDNTTMAPAETEWDTPTFGHELYNHTGDTGLWWDSPQLAEVADVVADPALAPVVAALRSQLKTRFYRSPAETAQRLNAVFQNTVMRQTDPLPWPINQHE
jgi:arylsulfatase A-like enzyme